MTDFRGLETFPMSPVDLGCEIGVGSVAPVVSNTCSMNCPDEPSRTLRVTLQDQIWAVSVEYLQQIFMRFGVVEVTQISGQFPLEILVQYNSTESAIVAKNWCDGLFLDAYCYLGVCFFNQQIDTQLQTEQLEHLRQGLDALSVAISELKSSLSSLKKEVSSQNRSLLMQVKASLEAAACLEAPDDSSYAENEPDKSELYGLSKGLNHFDALMIPKRSLETRIITLFAEIQHDVVKPTECLLNCQGKFCVQETRTGGHMLFGNDTVTEGNYQKFENQNVQLKACHGEPVKVLEATFDWFCVWNKDFTGMKSKHQCLSSISGNSSTIAYACILGDNFIYHIPEMFFPKEVGYPPPDESDVISLESISWDKDIWMGEEFHDLVSVFFHKLYVPDYVDCYLDRLWGVLNDKLQYLSILNVVYSVIAVAANDNEIVKESFMELKTHELTVQILRKHGIGGVDSLYDAIRVLLTHDDYRVLASQVCGYARKFPKVGIVEALVDSLKEGISSPSLVSASNALKAVVVNDEICKSIAEKGGVDSVRQCIDGSGEQHNTTVARVSRSLLSKLAGRDSIKNSIVQKGGLDRLIKISARFSDDPSILQEFMSIISILSLRSPDNAARAVEAGAGGLAIQAMQKFICDVVGCWGMLHLGCLLSGSCYHVKNFFSSIANKTKDADLDEKSSKIRLRQCLYVLFECYLSLSLTHKKCISMAFVLVMWFMRSSINRNAEGSTTVVSNMCKRAIQASHFMRQIMQTLWKQGVENGSKDSPQSLDDHHILNGEEALCRVLVQLHFRKWELGSMNLIRKLLSRVAESVHSEKELVWKLNQLDERLKQLMVWFRGQHPGDTV